MTLVGGGESVKILPRPERLPTEDVRLEEHLSKSMWVSVYVCRSVCQCVCVCVSGPLCQGLCKGGTPWGQQTAVV